MPSTINASSGPVSGVITTGDTSGQLELQANGSTKLSITSSGVNLSGLAFPTTDGTNGQVLQTNGSGTLSFATPAGGSWIYISSQTASNSATINFTNISSTYDMYVMQLVQIVPATGGASLYMRTSTNNGSSYDSGASDYQSGKSYNQSGDASLQNIGAAAGSAIDIFNTASGFGISSTASEGGLSGLVYFYKPSATSYFLVSAWASSWANDDKLVTMMGGGLRQTAADVDAVRFLMSSGNITSGTFRLYGIKNT